MKEHRLKNLSFATNIHVKNLLPQYCLENSTKWPCCKICQKKFAWKRSLDDHKKRHTGEWNWSCDYCSKGFISHFQMMKHIRNRHTLEKLFTCTCNICGKSFEGWDSLKIHQSVHSQQKMFQCRTCTSSFREAINKKKLFFYGHFPYPP